MATAAKPSTPVVENFGFMKDYPYLSAKLGKGMADSAGLDSSDPSNLARALSSNAAKTKIKTFERSADDQAAIDKLFTLPGGAEVGGSLEKTTKAQQQALAEGTRAKLGVYGDMKDATAEYSRLASFNKEAETQKRLKELNPTADIDEQITNVMTQAIREKARLRSELSDIDPGKRNAAITARMSAFTSEIANLSELRKSRVETAKVKIGEEIDAKEGQIDAARARVDSLAREMDFLKEIGADRVQYAEISRQYADAQAKLAKASSGSGFTSEDMIYNKLSDKFYRENNRLPNDQEQQDIRRQAKEIKATRPDIMKKLTEPPKIDVPAGSNSAMAGVITSGGLANPPDPFADIQLQVDKKYSADTKAAQKKAGIKGG